MKRPCNPRLKKGLGQHHLIDGSLCQPLIDYLQPADRRVLEIGPGGGVLTAELVMARGRVAVCEVDPEWAFTLRRRFEDTWLGIVVLDALALDWSRLPVPTLVAGNLPFNVGTRIIEALLPHAEQVPKAAFMVQKEVADRMVAGPGDSAYGSFSVLVAAHSKPRFLGTVGPESFRPRPKIAAAFVGLELKTSPVEPERRREFSRFIRLAFALRRKTLRNSLASGLGREVSEQLLQAAGLATHCRAQDLDLAAFVGLFEHLRRISD